MNILLGMTGSVATILHKKLRQALLNIGEVKCVATSSALRFIDDKDSFIKDEDEWDYFNLDNKKILHIDLRNWADVLVISPCTLNTLAKISGGFCDNLLTNTVRAWDYKKPLIIALAGNTKMIGSPLTSNQVEIMKNLGAKFIPSTSKVLACGEVGDGAMADIDSIVESVKNEVSITIK